MKTLRLIFIAQCVLLVALAISLCLYLNEAANSSARCQALYLIGLRDGELHARNQLLRAELERQLIEEQATANLKQL